MLLLLMYSKQTHTVITFSVIWLYMVEIPTTAEI